MCSKTLAVSSRCWLSFLQAPTLKELRFIMPHVKALGSAWWSMRFALLLVFLLDYQLDI